VKWRHGPVLGKVLPALAIAAVTGLGAVVWAVPSASAGSLGSLSAGKHDSSPTGTVSGKPPHDHSKKPPHSPHGKPSHPPSPTPTPTPTPTSPATVSGGGTPTVHGGPKPAAILSSAERNVPRITAATPQTLVVTGRATATAHPVLGGRPTPTVRASSSAARDPILAGVMGSVIISGSDNLLGVDSLVIGLMALMAGLTAFLVKGRGGHR
jgi:hypothetical protein